MTAHKEPSIYISFENVPIDKMGAEIIPSKLEEVLCKLMNDDKYFDLGRLRTFIERYKLNLMSSLDNCPHDALSSIIIIDFLYGNNLADVSNIFLRVRSLKINLYS